MVIELIVRPVVEEVGVFWIELWQKSIGIIFDFRNPVAIGKAIPVGKGSKLRVSQSFSLYLRFKQATLVCLLHVDFTLFQKQFHVLSVRLKGSNGGNFIVFILDMDAKELERIMMVAMDNFFY